MYILKQVESQPKCRYVNIGLLGLSRKLSGSDWLMQMHDTRYLGLTKILADVCLDHQF